MPRSEPELLILQSSARIPAGAGNGKIAISDANGTITWVDVATFAGNLPADSAANVASLRTLGMGARQAMPGNTTLDDVVAPAAPVAMNGKRLTGLGDATAATDGLNRETGDGRYPQRTNNGSDFLDSGTTRLNLNVPILGACVAAATSNITLSGTQTIDTVACGVNDYVLCTGQTDATKNGPWSVQSGAWVRPSSFATGATILRGRLILVTGGSANAGIWALAASTGGLVVDTNTQAWSNQAIGGTGPPGIQGPPGTAGAAGAPGPSTGWGDGSDGSVTLNGTTNFTWARRSGSTYTLLRDVYATSLTVNGSVTLITAGYRVFASGTLTNNGAIHNDGTTPTVATAAAPGGLGGFYGSGGAGGYASRTAGSQGVAGGASGGSPSASLGGSSGAGGSSGNPWSGGAAVTVTAPSAPQGGVPRAGAALITPTMNYVGGPGGPGVSLGISVAGGGGGGIVAIFANTLTNAGAIHARGGDGQTGSGIGGGGGGGGFVGLVYATLNNTGTIDANGGAGGGSGATGGANGRVVQIPAV